MQLVSNKKGLIMYSGFPVKLSCRIVNRSRVTEQDKITLSEIAEISSQNHRAKDSISILLLKEKDLTQDKKEGIEVIAGAAEVRATDLLAIRRVN